MMPFLHRWDDDYSRQWCLLPDRQNGDEDVDDIRWWCHVLKRHFRPINTRDHQEKEETINHPWIRLKRRKTGAPAVEIGGHCLGPRLWARLAWTSSLMPESPGTQEPSWGSWHHQRAKEKKKDITREQNWNNRRSPGRKSNKAGHHQGAGREGE